MFSVCICCLTYSCPSSYGPVGGLTGRGCTMPVTWWLLPSVSLWMRWNKAERPCLQTLLCSMGKASNGRTRSVSRRKAISHMQRILFQPVLPAESFAILKHSLACLNDCPTNKMFEKEAETYRMRHFVRLLVGPELHAHIPRVLPHTEHPRMSAEVGRNEGAKQC